MITVEQARQFYPPDRRPSDQELRKLLAVMYSIASREWELLMEEKANERE